MTDDGLSPVDDSSEEEPSEEEPSGSVFRGVAKHSLIYGLGMIASRAVSFIMLPIYTRFLTTADFGVMTLIETSLDFISIIGGGQLALGVFRFYHKTNNPMEQNEIVSTSFFLVGILYAIVGVGTFLGAGPLSNLLFDSQEHVLVIRIAAMNIAAGSLLIVPLSLARVQDKSLLYVGVGLTRLVLAVTLNTIFIVGMGMGILGIFLSGLIAASVTGIGLTVWMIRSVGVHFSTRWLGDLVRYGVPLMGMQVATFMATFSDRFFLNAYSDEGTVGIYGLAYQFGFLLAVVGFTPVDTVWGPKRFEVARRSDADRVLAQGFVIGNLLLITVAVGICLYVSPVLRVMATPEFFPAADFVPLILIAYVLQSWAGVQDIGILLKEKTQYLTLANLVSAVVAVTGYAVLIPRYFAWGAAIATVASFATRYALTYWFAQRLTPIQYRWSPVMVLVGWGVALCGIALTLPEMGVWSLLAVRTGFVAVYFIGLWFLPILQEDERDLARGIGRTVIAKARRSG